MKKQNVLVPVLFYVKANITKSRTVRVTGDLSNKARSFPNEDTYETYGYVVVFVRPEQMYEEITTSNAKTRAKTILYANDPHIRLIDILEVKQLYKLSELNFQDVSLMENGTFAPRVFEPKYPAKKGKK